MAGNTSRAGALARRTIDRLVSVTGVLAMAIVTLPAGALAGGESPLPSDRIRPAILGLTQAGDEAGRNELPLEIVVIGAVLALGVGMSLAFLIGGRRRRRRPSGPVADRAAAGLPGEVGRPPAALSWPPEDGDVFQATVPPRHDDAVDPPWADDRAVQASEDGSSREGWPAQGTTMADARETSALSSGLHPTAPAGPWPAAPDPQLLESPVDPQRLAQDAAPWPAQAGWPEAAAAIEPGSSDRSTTAITSVPAARWSDLPLPYAASPASELTAAPRADALSARSSLGTPAAPLVVQLQDEREPAARHHRGPNLPVVAAIGTVAAGVAFSAGAAVGATLGLGVGAAIGLAFAGGAGVAIGAAVALLGGRRS